jgi:hypothetical protein
MQRIHVLVTALFMSLMTACALDPGDAPGAQPTQGWTAADSAPLDDSSSTTLDVDGKVAGARGEAFAPGPTAPIITSANGGPCPTPYVCLYQNGNRAGFGVGFRAGVGFSNLQGISCAGCSNGLHGNDGTFNDQMSSWENRSGRQYCWYFDANFSTRNIFHHMGNGDIHNTSADENDRASSIQPC